MIDGENTSTKHDFFGDRSLLQCKVNCKQYFAKDLHSQQNNFEDRRSRKIETGHHLQNSSFFGMVVSSREIERRAAQKITMGLSGGEVRWTM
jgi:hypothetical protein